jgi:hypothetical protein
VKYFLSRLGLYLDVPRPRYTDLGVRVSVESNACDQIVVSGRDAGEVLL